MAKYVGQRIKRTEDPRLIKGLGHYVDDIRLPDTLHVAFLRSMYAHARITSIDVSEASHAPGVVAVYTGKDVAAKIGPVPCAAALPDLKVPDYRVLATDHVVFVGQPIAVVVATDRYAARDAIDLIMIEYEELPAVVDVEEAAKGGPLVYEEYGDNIAYKLTAGEGDIDAALKASDRRDQVSASCTNAWPRSRWKARGVLARYFPGEQELTIWSSTQIPHLLEDSARADDWDARKQAASDYSRGWRRVWIEAECLCRRSAPGLDIHATRQTSEMDREVGGRIFKRRSTAAVRSAMSKSAATTTGHNRASL